MKKECRLKMAILSIIIFSFVRCSNDQPDPLEIVARVGDEYLTTETVNSLVPQNVSGDDRDFLIKNLVDKWIDRQALAQMAQSEGIELTPNALWQIESVKLEMYSGKLLQEKIPKHFNITDKEIEDYYNSNKSQFERQSDEVHIVHMHLEKLDRAITTEVKQSNSLNEVIKKNFLDRQITRVVEPNGDLGYVEVDKLRPELRKAIRGTKTGIIYGPVRTDEGYHYIQVLDRKAAKSIRSLDLVRPEIINILKVEKRRRMIESYKEQVKRNFEIETFLGNIE